MSGKPNPHYNKARYCTFRCINTRDHFERIHGSYSRTRKKIKHFQGFCQGLHAENLVNRNESESISLREIQLDPWRCSLYATHQYALPISLYFSYHQTCLPLTSVVLVPGSRLPYRRHLSRRQTLSASAGKSPTSNGDNVRLYIRYTTLDAFWHGTWSLLYNNNFCRA